MRLYSRVMVVGVLSLAGAVGCSAVEPPNYDTDPRVVKLRAASGKPLAYGVTLGLPTLPAPATRPGDDTRHAAAIDARDLQRQLLDVLQREKLFRSVTASTSSDLGTQLTEGWGRHDDLVLQIDVRRADVTYEGINGWFYANVFFWFYAWAPSWWVADEDYAANLEVELRLVSVHSGQTVYRREYQPTITRELDDFDRGWSLLATIFPGSLDAEDWKGVAELLLPHVVHEFKVGLFETIRNELPPVTRANAFERDMAKTLYLGIGITAQKSYRVDNVAWAENDAVSLGAALRGGLQLGERNVRVVANAQATKESILQNVREFLVDRARPGDTLVCYVGCRGMVLPDGRPALVPYFFEPKTAAQDALPLDEFLEALDAAPGRVVLVLDVGWQGDVAGRGVTYIDDVVHGTCDASAFDTVGRAGRLVLCAAGPGDGAYEIEENQHSLLVHYLLQGLEGEADANDDGTVTAAEAVTFAKDEAARQAGLQGHSQTPWVLGSAPGATLSRVGGVLGVSDGR